MVWGANQNGHGGGVRRGRKVFGLVRYDRADEKGKVQAGVTARPSLVVAFLTGDESRNDGEYDTSVRTVVSAKRTAEATNPSLDD